MKSEDNLGQPSLQTQLFVRNGRAAVDFYKTAFGAVEHYRFGGTDEIEDVIAQLAIGDSLFWVENESPPQGNFQPRDPSGRDPREFS